MKKFQTTTAIFLEDPKHHHAGGQRYVPIIDQHGGHIALVAQDEGDIDDTPEILAAAPAMHRALSKIADLIDNPCDPLSMLRHISMFQATALDSIGRTSTNEPPTVVVYVSGGSVQGVSADDQVRVYILDADVDIQDAIRIDGGAVNAFEEYPKLETERVRAIRALIETANG